MIYTYYGFILEFKNNIGIQFYVMINDNIKLLKLTMLSNVLELKFFLFFQKNFYMIKI